MHRLADHSLKNRALIALVTLAIAFFGVISMTSLKQELIPSISLPQVSVVTTYQGASPEIVDRDVTAKIESALQGLQGLESTTTTSGANRSVVQASFTYGTDIVYAEQRIQQAINRIKSQLPDDADSTVLSGSIDDLPIVQIAVTGGDKVKVAEQLNSYVLGELRTLTGVRGVDLFGDLAERITISPDQAALAEHGLSIQSIRDTLDRAGVLIPAGQLTQGDETLTVQAGTLLKSVDDLTALPLVGGSGGQGASGQDAGQGAAPGTEPTASANPGEATQVTLGDVATVTRDYEPAASISRVNGEDALTISVTKRPSANTVDVSNEVSAALPELQSSLGDGVTMQIVSDQAPFIVQSIDTLVTEGLLGLGFAVLVIFVFLLSVRATLVTAISIPTSLLVTFIAINFADYSLNILTLGALTIAIGRVVDDSIVVVENVRRHMELHPTATHRGAERVRVIAGAVREVAGAITASTIATVAVYLPIVFVADVTGELFRPFALTSAIAMLASLVVALTIVPVLCYWFLGGGRIRAAKDAAARAGGDVPVAEAGADAEERAGRLDGAPAESAAPAHAQPLADDGASSEPAAPAHALPLTADGVSRQVEAPEAPGRHAAPIIDGLAVSTDAATLDRRDPGAEIATGADVTGADATTAAASAPHPTSELDHDEPRNWLQKLYEPLLRFAIRRPAIILIAAVLVLAGTVLAAPLMKTNFLGSSGQNVFNMRQDVAVNASLASMTDTADRLDAMIKDIPGVETRQVSFGSNALAAAFGGGGSSSIRWTVTTAEGFDPDAVQEQVRDAIAGRTDLGDVTIGFGGGFTDSMAVRVSAPDLATLDAAIADVTPHLQGVEGVTSVTSDRAETRPFVQLDIDQAKAAQYGLTEATLGAQVAQALQPLPIGRITIDGSQLQMYFIGDKPAPTSVDELRDLEIPFGPTSVTLADLATVTVEDGPATITAESGTPYADLTIESSADNLGGLGASLEQAIDGVELPAGAKAELAGSASDQREAFAQLGLALLAAILIVYIVMVATFGSLLQPLLLLVSVPFAATGAILLQVVTGVPLGVASLIGVLMLIGIVVTNAIVLIDLVNQFRRRGLRVREAMFEGGTRRVRPIIMTALATILALTPMAIGITGHGGFISQAMALVVIGGLLSSTLLTLVVLPSLYVAVEGRLERRAERRAERTERKLREAGLA